MVTKNGFEETKRIKKPDTVAHGPQGKRLQDHSDGCAVCQQAAGRLAAAELHILSEVKGSPLLC